jgi:hypothetical protein
MDMTFPSACLIRIAAGLSLGVLFMLPLLAFGEEPAFVGPPAPPPPTDAVNALDKPRDYLSGKLVSFVSSLDRFFGNDRNYQEANDSVFQFDIDRVMGYGEQHDFVFSGRANVHLPIAEQKLRLVFESDPDKSATVDPKQTPGAPINRTSRPESYAAALRFEKEESERFHHNADVGVKFNGLLKSPSPFVRTRLGLEVPLEQWHVKMAETVFWFNSIGVGETTQVDFERPISEPLLFRATSVAAWLKDANNFDLRQDLTLFDKLDDRTAVYYQASAIGVTQPQTEVTEYVLMLLYRYRLHREWMFLELSPQLHFPRTLDFQPNWLFSMRLEMLFDETK